MTRSIWLFLVGISLTAIGCQNPPARPAAAPRPRIVRDRDETPDPSVWVERLVELHNKERRQRGLREVEIDPKLRRAAERHAQDMASRQRMSHRGSDLSSPFDRMARAGYIYQSAAENVAYGQNSPEEAVDAWMHSPPHRRAILGKYSQIGAACATAPDGTFAWCVTFGEPSDG